MFVYNLTKHHNFKHHIKNSFAFYMINKTWPFSKDVIYACFSNWKNIMYNLFNTRGNRIPYISTGIFKIALSNYC